MVKKSQEAEKQEDIRGAEMNEETVAGEVNGQEEPAGEAEEEAAGKSKEEELMEKLAELQDKYLRLTAEYDNYRKRTLREKMELLDGAKSEVLITLLPVVDDMDRAMGSVQDAKDIEAVRHGMNLIHSKFKAYLNQQGVKEVEALNKEFDTDLHEAVTKIHVDNKKKKGKVVDVIEKGYILKDRVIRFAKVVIGE